MRELACNPSVFDEGSRAYSNGHDKNPYRVNSLEFLDWLEGYRTAEIRDTESDAEEMILWLQIKRTFEAISEDYEGNNFISDGNIDLISSNLKELANILRKKKLRI